MPLEIKGVDELLAQLEKKFAKAKIKRVVNKVLRAGGDDGVERLKQALDNAYQDTGETSKGVIHGNVSWSSGEPRIVIGNNGNHWTLVHLNEFGYTRKGKYYPGAGRGVMQRFADSYAKEWEELIRKEVEELLR